MARVSASIVAGMPLVLALAAGAASAQAGIALASRSAGGSSTGSAASNAVTMTPDGRFVLFNSQAANLVAGQTDAAASFDVFVFDRQAATTTLVSRAAGTTTTAANNNSIGRAISADGRYVVYQTLATDLVAGVTDTNAAADVYLFDQQTGAHRLLSHAAASLSQTANNASTAFNDIAIDPTGAFVLFQSRATDIVAGITDSNGVEDLFLFEIQGGARTLVSRSAVQASSTGAGQSLPLQIGADASFILYQSSAPDVAGNVSDTNGTFDAYLYDRASGTTSLLSTAAGLPTQTANGMLVAAAITPDARFVLVNTQATDMIDGQVDSAGTDDVFLLDLQAGTRRLLSGVNGSLTQAMGATQTISRRQLSADGRFVVISTQGSNLVAGVSDTNAANDLYLYDRDADTTVLISGANGSTTATANGLTGAARLSGDGASLIVSTQATNFAPGITDANGASDVFLIDTGTLSRTLLSAQAGLPASTANGPTLGVLASADGTRYLFDSGATNLVFDASDTNNANDVFLAARLRILLLDGFEDD